MRPGFRVRRCSRVVYWVGAELFLIDPEKADLAVWQAILISAASLAVGWVIYDAALQVAAWARARRC